MTRHKCFNCGAPSETEVYRPKPPTFRRFICLNARCWKAWWALETQKEANHAA